MPAKTSCTLQIYGHIYILGITTEAVSILLHAAFFAIGSMLGTIYTPPWVNSVHWISYTVHYIWEDTWGKNDFFFSPPVEYLQLVKGAIFTVLTRIKRELSNLFNYIGCKGLIPKAPSKWLMWMWFVGQELFEMWAVFQWSMYKVHEQKNFQWMKQLLLYVRIYELLSSFC